MIKHPQLKQSANPVTPPPVLYRGDGRAPKEIVSKGGITSHGKKYDALKDHMMGKVTDGHESGYVSMTSNIEVAKTFAAPIGSAETRPGTWLKGPAKVAEGWVYEVEPNGNVISFEAEATTEYEQRMTGATKEWVAVRMVALGNVVRATKYRREFPVDKKGGVTNLNAEFRKVETWENDEYRKGDKGYNPYLDPSSGWNDKVKLF